ncbi:O-antigen ligase [Proteus mirabilis]|uniref:O-antigen polymerase n=3 Tax=Proteus mirabilis TaxID=584 RepID=UPI00234BA34E|nr:O-antigen polymerase [Proteus mirabilis]MDC5928335.1 O-antigen ligase [Proteus mirabilis]
MIYNKLIPLWNNKGKYSELYSFFPIICVLIIPIFYTFIIFPFYYQEKLYQLFAIENSIFWISIFLVLLALTKLIYNRKKIKPYFFSKNTALLFSYLYIGIVFFYIILNFILIGFNEFYSGCHYCGNVLGGFELLRIIIFDLGTVTILLLPACLIIFRKNKVYLLIHIVTTILILSYYYVGSYRNQLLPIIFLFFLIFINNYRPLFKKIFFILFLFLSPVAAISMAFYHYFKNSDSPLTLYDYFSMNEFYSNYNNFIIYESGFSLDLPFSGSSYLGPFLHKLNSLIDTGFVTSASQMAQYMDTGIGYGFSPLLEALLNFGDLFLFGSLIVAFTIYISITLIMFSKNDLISTIYFSLFIFFVFNINRVDFTSAFNIYFHKLILIWLFTFFTNTRVNHEKK